MALVSAKPLGNYPWFLRLIFWKQKRTYGSILGPGLLWGRSPRVFAAVTMLYGALERRSSPLPAALRSLVIVRVSQINQCAFCVDINSATLANRGIAMDKIAELARWPESPVFTPDERLALECAEAMTITGPGVSSDLRQRLRMRWDEDTIVELTALIAFQNLSSKFNAAHDVPSQGFCVMPKQSLAAR